MTLAIGDHLVIKRNGQIVDPKSEAFHEYEVVEGENGANYVSFPEFPQGKYPPKCSCKVKLEVVE
jgi:hypothetical protein